MIRSPAGAGRVTTGRPSSPGDDSADSSTRTPTAPVPGPAAAACALIEGLGATVAGVHVLLELGFLSGRARLGERDVRSLLVEA